MAKTYTYGDALTTIGSVVPRTTEDDKAAVICNLALNEIWKRHDWPESVALLPPFSLTPGEQDHGAPAVAVPEDFYGLRRASLVELAGVPAKRTPLKIYRDLDLTEVRGLPEVICFDPATTGFRVYPRVPENIGPPNWQIDGVYKKRPVKLLGSALHSTLLPFDDVYFRVWIEMLKWAAWNLSGNPQAGEVVIANRQTSFSGQLGRAIQALNEMASDNGLLLGDATVTPSQDTWF